jgi:hypothetical protein
MKIIPLSLFFAGITLFSCSNESTNNLSTNSQKVKLNKNEVLSIAYDDAKELTDKDIFNMVSSFANMNNNGVSRSTSASFKITKRTYINKEGEFQKFVIRILCMRLVFVYKFSCQYSLFIGDCQFIYSCRNIL